MKQSLVSDPLDAGYWSHVKVREESVTLSSGCNQIHGLEFYQIILRSCQIEVLLNAVFIVLLFTHSVST